MTEKAADYILAPSVTLAAAQRAVAAALEEARTLSLEVCVAVTDRAGHLLAFARMDHAPILCARIAQDKAYSVAAFGGLPTSEWWPLLESDPPLLHGITKTERLIVFGGGVPLTVEGRAIGAIGVEQLHTGIVHVNDQTLNNDASASFGSTGNSGNGSRFGSQSSWDEFTQWQWITMRPQTHGFPF